MIEPKIYYPETTINKMNVPFTIRLAVTDQDSTIEHILDTTTELIEKDLGEIDDKFSPYKLNSLISKFHRGDPEPFFQDEMFQIIYNQCAIAKTATNGYFNAFKNDRFDPTGLLLGWAIENEFQKHLKPLLVDPSIVGVSLSSGQQMQLGVDAKSSFEWNIAVSDPEDHSKIAEYKIRNGAIATVLSANSDISKRREVEFADQITILSKGLTEAFVLANAGLKDNFQKIEQWMEQAHLTGMLVKDSDDIDIFANGYIDNFAQVQM